MAIAVVDFQKVVEAAGTREESALDGEVGTPGTASASAARVIELRRLRDAPDAPGPPMPRAALTSPYFQLEGIS